MKYTIEGLRDASATMTPIARGSGKLVYVMGHSIFAEFNKIVHEFQLSDGGVIILTTNTKEEQMKPAEIIKQEKQVLEQSIREACKKFVEATGVAVQRINVEFMETTTFGGDYETRLAKVEVDYRA